MGYSSLAKYKSMTTHKSSGRGGKTICYIAIHHMAGNLTVEQCGNVFKNCEVSAHYGIGNDGRIGVYVDEKDTAWALGNFNMNQKSINIELANDGGASTNWHVSDKVIKRCIELVADIAYRNGWKTVDYTGDLNGDIIAHRWVASTACPGGYMIKNKKLKYIATEANKLLQAKRKRTPSKPTSNKITIDGKWGKDTTKKTQKVLRTTQDGIVSGQLRRCKRYLPNCMTSSWIFGNTGKGSAMVKAIQKLVGSNKIDGLMGKDTVKDMQKFLRAKGFYTGAITGIMDANTVKGWQKQINNRL